MRKWIHEHDDVYKEDDKPERGSAGKRPQTIAFKTNKKSRIQN